MYVPENLKYMIYQLIIGLSYYASGFFLPCSSPWRQWSQQFGGLGGEGKRVSPWKRSNCMVQSHSRKNRGTSMSCSLCTRIKRIHIESQITMHTTTLHSVCAQERHHIDLELSRIIPFNILVSLFQHFLITNISGRFPYLQS